MNKEKALGIVYRFFDNKYTSTYSQLKKAEQFLWEVKNTLYPVQVVKIIEILMRATAYPFHVDKWLDFGQKCVLSRIPAGGSNTLRKRIIDIKSEYIGRKLVEQVRRLVREENLDFFIPELGETVKELEELDKLYY